MFLTKKKNKEEGYNMLYKLLKKKIIVLILYSKINIKQLNRKKLQRENNIIITLTIKITKIVILLILNPYFQKKIKIMINTIKMELKIWMISLNLWVIVSFIITYKVKKIVNIT